MDLQPGKYYQVNILNTQPPNIGGCTIIEALFYSETLPGHLAVYNYEAACGHLLPLSDIVYAEELPLSEVRRRYPCASLARTPAQRIEAWLRKRSELVDDHRPLKTLAANSIPCSSNR